MSYDLRDAIVRIEQTSRQRTALALQNACIIYIVLWASSPLLAYDAIYRVIALGAVGFFVLLEFLRWHPRRPRPKTVTFLVAFFIFYTVAIEVVANSISGTVRYLQIYIMLFFAIVYDWRKEYIRSLFPVLWAILITLPIWELITILTITSGDTRAARIGVRVSEEAIQLAGSGVGGYGLVYTALLALPALVYLRKAGTAWHPNFLTRRPKLANSILALNLALSIGLVIFSGYSIAALFMFATLGTALIIRKATPSRILGACGLLLFLAVFWKTVFETTLKLIQPMVEGTNYALKVGDLLWTIRAGDATGTFSDRQERYTRSINVFLDNWLTGSNSFDAVGKHSAVLDGLAQWGILVGGIFVILVFFPAFIALRHRSTLGLGLGAAVAATGVFVLNDAFASAGIVIYILLPVTAWIMSETSRAGRSTS